MLNLAPILAPFLVENLSKSCKVDTLKIAISHKTSLKKWPPRPPKQPPGRVFKKCMKIDTILSDFGIQKCIQNWWFFISFFVEIAILAQTSLKNRHPRSSLHFCNFTVFFFEIELSPTRELHFLKLQFPGKLTFPLINFVQILGLIYLLIWWKNFIFFYFY